jgi:hypothetical protein
MIDNITMRISDFEAKEWELIMGRLERVTVRVNKTYGRLSNLQITYLPNSKELWIKNSLHKFYNAVVRDIPMGQMNHDDFDIEKIKLAAMYLAELTNRKTKDFELIGGFEYGLNIKVFPLCPMNDILEDYISYASTRINLFYTHSAKKGKPKGRSCYLTDYRIKFYDKSKQALLSEKGVFRYEICNYGIGALKRLFGLVKVTLKELLSKKYLRILAKDLIKKYDMIKKLPMDKSKIPRTVLLELFAYATPHLNKYDKGKMSEWKYAKHRKMGKELMEQYTSKDGHSKIREKIVKKLDYLINSNLYNIRGKVNDVIV